MQGMLNFLQRDKLMKHLILFIFLCMMAAFVFLIWAIIEFQNIKTQEQKIDRLMGQNFTH